MGRGSSGISGGGGAGASGGGGIKDFPEAFAPGVDFERSGDVDHRSRTVTSSLQRQWDAYASQMNQGVTSADEQAIMKDWDPRTGALYGYIRTTNSFAINQALYDPANAGKSDAQIFTRTDRNGVKRDLRTVRTLDSAIANNSTPADASYVRFGTAGAIQATFGLSGAQMQLLRSAPRMNASQLASLNKALSGSTSYSKAYTSVSANRSMNAFKSPYAPQSRNYWYERKISVPKGTKAFASKNNAQESEIIFGRRMQTKITGISISNDGHIVIHEMFDKYV